MLDKFNKIIKKHKRIYEFLITQYNIIHGFIRERKTMYYIILRMKAYINTRYKLNLYQISSVKRFCCENNLKYLIVEKEQLRKVCIPHYFGDQGNEEIKELRSQEIYIAELVNAEIVGANSFIIADNKCLYDMAAMDIEKRYDLRFEGIKNIDEKFALIEYIGNNQVFEEAIFMIGFASFNYYHISLELLSRLQGIDDYEEYRSIPLLIDEIVLEIPQYKDMLEKINRYNHPIIPVKLKHIYKVKRLIYPSYNTWIPINVKNRISFRVEDFLIAKSGVKYLRNTILKDTELIGYRKIYISRINLNNKRLINENEVAGLFAKYGFEIIFPEILSFDEQVEIFSKAKYIAGSTGAALTNILYCSANATIITIIPKEYNFYLFSTISKIINLKTIYLDAKITKKGKNISADQFELDLENCDDLLKTL